MSEQSVTPPHLDPKYLGLLNGTCPNTGERCEALGDLRFSTDVSRDCFKMGIGDGPFSFDAMTKGQREAYDRSITEAEQRAATIQQVLGGRCIDSCTPQETS